MRVRITTPEHLDDLASFLSAETNAVVQRLSAEELEVSLLGSYDDEAMRMDLYLRLRAWEAGRRPSGAEVEIID
jgi:hypothetical protein